ncbi:MAG: hypothetical protein ACRDD1_09595, partial [Planctomycetia bacterium]
ELLDEPPPLEELLEDEVDPDDELEDELPELDEEDELLEELDTGELLELGDPDDDEPPPELDVELEGGVPLLDEGGKPLLDEGGGTQDELDDELLLELEELLLDELLDEFQLEELLDGGIDDELLNHPLDDIGHAPWAVRQDGSRQESGHHRIGAATAPAEI